MTGNEAFDTLKEAAYHEAGHAVVAQVLGIEVRCLIIRDDPGEGAYCQLDDPFPPIKSRKVPLPPLTSDDERELSDRLAVADVAGEPAVINAGIEPRPHGGDMDRQQASDHGWRQGIPKRDRHAYVLRCEERATDLVKRYWAAVDALAQVAMSKKRLTDSDEIRSIIDHAMGRLQNGSDR